MEKYTVANVERIANGEDGQPLMTKDGRQYVRVKLFVKEKPGITLFGFENKQTQYWKVGDIVTLRLEEYVNQQGRKSLNFRVPSVYDRLDLVETRLDLLEQKKFNPLKADELGTPFDVKSDPIPPEEVPF